MKLITKIVTLSILIFAINACDENDTGPNVAKKLTVEELSQTLYWFDTEYGLYQPDQAAVQGISDEFDPVTDRVYFFFQLACNCKIPQEPIPHLIKSLDQAGVDQGYMEIYSLKNTATSHPFEHLFKIKRIPSIFLARASDSIPVYSVLDTMNSIQTKYPDSTIKVEQLLLEALKMY